MKNQLGRGIVALWFAASAATVWAAGMGIVTGNGEFTVDQAKVSGSATLFDGSVIETGEAPSRIQIQGGPRIELAAHSKATVRRDRMVLAAGMGEAALPGGYEVQSGELRIVPARPDSAARVARRGEKVVEVAAVRGALKVFNAGGLQIANVAPGVALAFEPQEGGAAPPSTFLGCLLKKSGRFVIYDQTTRLIVELRGRRDFAGEWGNRVQVIGTTDPSAESNVAAQVVNVTSLTRFGQGGCAPVARAIAAELPPAAAEAAKPGAQSRAPAEKPVARPAKTTPRTAPKAPSGGGMSAGTKVLIIAAVGGGGGAAAAVLAGSGKGRSRD